MYKTEINELAGNRFQVCIYDGRNKLVFSRIRKSYDEARAEQVQFMYTGPDSKTKSTGIRKRKKKRGDGTGGAPMEVARYLFGIG